VLNPRANPLTSAVSSRPGGSGMVGMVPAELRDRALALFAHRSKGNHMTADTGDV